MTSRQPDFEQPDSAGGRLGQTIIELRDVRFAWPDDRGFSLRIDHFSLRKGERTLLIGPSGSGKSTLLSLITGVVAPSQGTVVVLEKDLLQMSGRERDRFRADHFGIIFQMFNLLPYGAVIDNVVLPLSFAPLRRGRAEAHGGAQHEARRLLSALGLDGLLAEGPAATLSIGQQQRAAAARALIGEPEIVIADEPTSALDRDHQLRFLDLLFAQADAAHSTLLMVSHDKSFVDRFDRIIDLAELTSKEPVQ